MALTPKQKIGAWMGAGALVTTVAFIQGNEGTVLPAYRDPTNILTACTGETHYIVTPGDIKPGAVFTREQCTEALYRSMWEHAQPVIDCTAPASLTPGQKQAFLDFTFNVGGATFCKSSIARKAKAGDLQGSCEAILMYRFAGDHDCAKDRHVCGGIWTRREREYHVCIAG